MKTIIIILMFFITFLLSKLAKKTNKIHIRFFSNIVRIILVILIIIIIGSDYFNEETTKTTLIKGSSLIIAIITFIAQKTLGNIVSGLSISISRPFHIGDKIKVLNGNSIISEGIVTDITLRHTVVTTYDRQTEIIPNSLIDDSVVINTNYTDDVGRFLEIQIGYDDNVDLAIDIIKKICNKEPLVTKISEPLLSSYNSSGITIKTTVFTKSVDDNFNACSNIRKSLLKAFKSNNIHIPYNTVTVEVLNE